MARPFSSSPAPGTHLLGLKQRLRAEGGRAVDALLAPRAISSHLIAICTAAYKPSVDHSPERELA